MKIIRKSVLVAVTLSYSVLSIAQPVAEKDLPFWDHKLPLEKRVNDVVSRLTLEEKQSKC